MKVGELKEEEWAVVEWVWGDERRLESLIHLEEKVGGFVVGMELEKFLFFECEVKFGFDEMDFLLEEGLILVMVQIRG